MLGEVLFLLQPIDSDYINLAGRATQEKAAGGTGGTRDVN
jgi:hypothetical protein